MSNPTSTLTTEPGTARNAGTRDIFIVSNSVDELGGITSWSHQVARLFSERGHTVHVVGVVPVPENRRADLGDDLPYRTTTLYDVHPPSLKSLRGLKGKLDLVERRRRAAREAGMAEQAAKLTRLFRAARPGAVVIVTQVWAMEWVALADTSGLRVIGMSHESFQTCRASSRFHRVKKYYKGVDRMLTLTREDADLWIGQRFDNVSSMPNPLPFFPEEPSPRTAKRVVSIGRLHEEKGVDMLLDAWAEVAPRHPDWTLRVYGSGEEEETLRQQCESLGVTGSVEWMGRTSDVAGALRESSLFALSSRGEGFPLALMEAMATAVPCVAFNVAPGVREIITDGENGLVVSPGNTSEFARRLDELMSDKDLRDDMGERARADIQRYSVDEVMSRWENLFALLSD
ncbi:MULTISPECIES: glycosyltransferase family 4 protein [unclassified Streptomyces]|uniref:glycosyltransferase family 4 protein n=1 Tax=unclassified Streptomyces TaxID=2593676 RepID=UPI0006AFDB5C|nr:MULTISPECIES: glycosyltransferase family 4 protein [unclassified Streptomyces]KOX27904.1 glycosyl transferase [Streptomyces sp. NRRL F-6491]KOX40663.1 glycosyl transferase [Streptomyces sp. NRRL F-6492]